MKDVIHGLLQLSDDSLDVSMKPLISNWSDPPTAIQVLEVLDHCVFGALASGFVMQVLEVLYDLALKREGVTREEVAAKATWRERHQPQKDQQ